MDFSKVIACAAVLQLVACAAEPTSPDGGSAGSTNQAGMSSSSGGSPGAAGSTTSMAGASVTTGGAPLGNAGSTGSAGSTSAGAGTGGGCGAVDMMGLISDFETGKAEVIATAGRDGSWFLYSDGSGTQTPMKIPNTPLAAEAGGACGSAYAFHTTGMGFNVWGAGVGADFAPKTAMQRTAYDLSAYSGVALRAKAAATTPLRVSISDANTAPEGMVCVDTTDATNAARCGDYFGAEVTLGTDFQDFTIQFADMKQRGWGLPVATGLDKAKAYTLRLQVKGSAQAPANFDLWLDDVRLLP